MSYGWVVENDPAGGLRVRDASMAPETHLDRSYIREILRDSPDRALASVMEQGIVAAVNAYVGSQARFLISPSSSSWTNFLEHMMGAAAAISLCCSCQHGRGLMRVLGAVGVDSRELEAAVAQSATCATPSC